jgi:hypothetical protein
MQARRNTRVSYTPGSAGPGKRIFREKFLVFRAVTARPADGRRLSGQDQDGTLGIGFPLLAQGADIDAQILHIGFSAPDFAQEEFVGQHISGIADQDAQGGADTGGQLLHANGSRSV